MGIFEMVVVGIFDLFYGEKLKVFIVINGREGLIEEEVIWFF